MKDHKPGNYPTTKLQRLRRKADRHFDRVAYYITHRDPINAKAMVEELNRLRKTEREIGGTN